MKAEKNNVVSFHYKLSCAGETVESSYERAPLVILLGKGSIIPGLEKSLLGRTVGEDFNVSISPEQAYGQRREDWVQRVPKKYFRQSERLVPGMTTVLKTQDGQRTVTIKKVGQTVVDVDLNHPMAGKTLDFDIEIIEIRLATEEELAHGHAHGPGGHTH